ncbi:SprT family zinc-dependent metalloprotease [Tenacibaculum agarivorans]|uniref:SprT family zinc-dependent metalloprotease n=1 Tax=Tenacibaculum agarivorans TaxID=1908389 RepID=UPI00094BA94A|nr:SprT family zinc-dependent metalloprotease [Tenacibaculum agarivorans]
METHKPTEEFYSLFQFLYDFLNQKLFDKQLPACMITVTRKTNTAGYFQPERWINDSKIKSDEIAINPTYFDLYPLVEILQTLAHEMCHLWQYHFGEPSKRTYHNKEWAEKMQSIGLMPSRTGEPGGKQVGQNMKEYPIPKGKFIKAANKLIEHKKFKLLWFDRVKKEKQLPENFQGIENEVFLSENPVYLDLNLDDRLLQVHQNSDIEKIPNKRGKGKYLCEACETHLWGKKGLHIICGECDTPFMWVEPEN